MPRPKKKVEVVVPALVLPVEENPLMLETIQVETVLTADTKPVEVVKPASDISKGRVTLRCQ